MNQILTSLEQCPNWKNLMRSSCKNNGLKTSLVSQLTPLKLETLGNRFCRSYEHLGQKVASTWIQNQLKAYHWILVALSGFQQILILDFKEEQWDLLQSIFLFKSRSFLKFEARRLVTTKMKNKKWIKQEDLLLKKLIEKSNSKNIQWNDIARQLFELSDQKIFKTGKHCRERWFNYLDPSKQRGQWTKEEDYFLVSQVSSSGKKWAQYALKLNRTEHAVKNRFNSLLIKQKKITPQFRKEEKLMQEIIIHFNENQEQSDLEKHPSQIQEEVSEQSDMSKKEQLSDHVQKMQTSKKEEQAFKEQNESRQIKSDNKKISKMVTIEEFEGKEVKQQSKNEKKQREISGMVSSLVRETEEDIGEYKNYLPGHEFGQIYSPFWTYSPNNGTPNNGFLNSPSPLSFYINYSFTNSFHRFTGSNSYPTNQKKEEM